MQALADPASSAFKVSERRVKRAVAWSETGLQEPSPPITAMNFVIEANQDRDELSVCENELSLTVGVAGHDLNVLEGEARYQTAPQRCPSGQRQPGSMRVGRSGFTLSILRAGLRRR